MRGYLLDHAWLAMAGLGLLVCTARPAPGAAGRIRIEAELTDQRVYQRCTPEGADFDITGTTEPARDCRLTLSVLRRAQLVAGFEEIDIPLRSEADADTATWSCGVRQLPVGGPYRFVFRLVNADGTELDAEDVDGVLVGDLWILAGQSNMDGCGLLADAEPPDEMVHVLSLANVWQVAEDPLHDCNEAAYRVYRTSYVTPTERRPVPHRARGTWPTWPASRGPNGAGLGIPFGKRVHQVSGVPIGLLACSLGGTTLEQWSPRHKALGGESLYGALLDRVRLAGGRVAGILWWQGESDCYGEGPGVYEERFTGLIEAIRADLKSPDLPFYTVQLGRQLTGGPVDASGKNLVREAQRRCMETIPGCGLVSSIDCAMSSSAHVDSAGYRTVGRRLANLALAKTYHRRDLKPGPRLRSAIREPGSNDTLRVSFDDVNGDLVTSNPISGFLVETVGPDGGRVLSGPLRVDLDAQSPGELVIVTVLPLSREARLWYGYGWDPSCNLKDELDMAVPAFGPVQIR